MMRLFFLVILVIGLFVQSPSQADPECVPKLTDYCNKKTVYAPDVCYYKATSACQIADSQFPDCVLATAASCEKNTIQTSEDCFEEAMATCKRGF